MDYTSVFSYDIKPLKASELELVSPIYDDPTWFRRKYQSRVRKAEAHRPTTLMEVLIAIHNSESKSRQYELMARNIKKIAHSLFVKDGWVFRDPVVAHYNGELYIVGGRHRVSAIVQTLAQCCLDSDLSDNWKQVKFEKCCRQQIRVDELYLISEEDLIQLILADNDGRRMRGAELASIEIQVEGADPDEPDSVIPFILAEGLTPQQRARKASAFFTLQPYSRIPPQSLSELGATISRWILYGDVVTPTKKSKLCVKDKYDLAFWLEKAVEILNEEYGVSGKITAETKPEYARKTIERLRQMRPEPNQRVI